jgi:group I intron endonuclease
MTQGIYSIKNKLNGKVYIGSSKNIEGRIYHHKQLLARGKHHSIKLQRAWNRDGADNFEFSIIETVEENINLFEVEQNFIDQYEAYNQYNVSKQAVGGDRGGGRPTVHPRLKKQTCQFVLLPVLIDAIAALGENKSHTIEAIILRHFGITPLQWEIYVSWIECDRQFNVTAEKLGRDRENIRQNVAKVKRKLKIKNNEFAS